MSPLFLRHAEKDVDEPTEGGGTSGPEPTGVQKCSLGYKKKQCSGSVSFETAGSGLTKNRPKNIETISNYKNFIFLQSYQNETDLKKIAKNIPF